MAKKKSSSILQEKAIRHRNSTYIGPEDVVVSSSESLPSDLELFGCSDTPMECFDDDDSLWPVKAVVSEEVDIFETSIFQIDWDPWTRSDGTRTTWMTDLPGPNTALTSWKGVQTRKRRQKALKDPGIDLELIGSFKPHNIHTAEQTCAYLEKLKTWPAILEDWNVEKIPVNSKSSTRRHSLDFKKRKRGASEEHFPSPASSQQNSFPDVERDISHQYIAPSSGQSSSSVWRYKGTSREKLDTIWNVESRWNAEAIDNGAASIRILNEVDGDPPVDPSFVYLEASREYAEGIRKPDPRLLMGCDCKDGCRNPLSCSCLAKSRCTDEDGSLCPAYDKKGRFKFTNIGEVVECNTNCTCRRCSNNVAQRPRKIPLELFKARERGWGVRPTVNVPCGTVLGIFSGNLMSRDDIVNLSSEEKAFSFDLDTRDNDPGFKKYRKYSISAHSAGNWSRFINHSCDPSAKVYSVVIDTILQDNMPYIAFVARKDIPARSEITIDYNPRAVEMMMKTKRKGKKGKGKAKAKGVPCVCGSELCRGFI